MAETSSAAPTASTSAQPSANPVDRATTEVLGSLPQEPKKANASAEAEIEDTGEDITPEEIKKVEAAAKKAYKLKVGGKDVEVDESELLKRAQMGYSADEKWQEAAKMRKQMDSFIGLLQRDPAKALEQMGFNVDELAEKRIQARIEEMRKSPEQLEKEKMQKELEDIKAEREREKEEVRELEKIRLQNQFAVEIENDISSALDNNNFGFPKTPYVVKRIADTMILAMQEGHKTNNQRLKNITAKDVLPIVQEEIRQELHDLYSTSPDEVFESLVGKDRLNKYRKSKIKKTLKTASTQDIKSTGKAELKKTQEEQSKAAKKVNAKDFFKTLGSK